MKIVKIVLLSAIGIGVILVLIKAHECNTRGNDSGKVFKCPFFSSVPIWLTAKDKYHMMKEEQCYEITDYGKEMTWKIVDKELCKNKSE